MIHTVAFTATFTKVSENPKASTLILCGLQLSHLQGCSALGQNIFHLVLKLDFKYKIWSEGT